MKVKLLQQDSEINDYKRKNKVLSDMVDMLENNNLKDSHARLNDPSVLPSNSAENLKLKGCSSCHTLNSDLLDHLIRFLIRLSEKETNCSNKDAGHCTSKQASSSVSNPSSTLHNDPCSSSLTTASSQQPDNQSSQLPIPSPTLPENLSDSVISIDELHVDSEEVTTQVSAEKGNEEYSLNCYLQTTQAPTLGHLST